MGGTAMSCCRVAPVSGSPFGIASIPAGRPACRDEVCALAQYNLHSEVLTAYRRPVVSAALCST